MRLYEINDLYRQAIENGWAVDLDTGEIYENATGIESIEGLLNDKLEACACVYKEMLAEADAIKAEKDRLAKREKAARNRAERLKGYITANMERADMRTLKTAKAAITTRRTSRVEVDDPEALSDVYKRVKVEPNKAAIKEALLHDVKVAGARLEESVSYSIS